MAKKYTITREIQVLLKLLRIALGTEPLDSKGEPVEAIQEDIDWAEVIRLSYKHKVSALAVDGLIASHYDPYIGLNEQQKEELGLILTPWINHVAKVEESYNYYISVLKTLCNIFISNGLTPIIIKGYGLGLNYPIPSHRGAGDIDVYLIDENGKPAAEKGVEIIEHQLGIKTTKVPHDYEFFFKGIEVELHYDLTNEYWKSEKETYIVETLTGLLLDNLIPSKEIEGAYYPSATFNAAYLVRHMFGHFYTASGNFRQYIDWFTFIEKQNDKIGWSLIERVWMSSGMYTFAKGMNYLISRRIGNQQIDGHRLKQANEIEYILVKDSIQQVEKTANNLQHIYYYWYNRKKFFILTGKRWYQLSREDIGNPFMRFFRKYLS